MKRVISAAARSSPLSPNPEYLLLFRIHETALGDLEMGLE